MKPYDSNGDACLARCPMSRAVWPQVGHGRWQKAQWRAPASAGALPVLARPRVPVIAVALCNPCAAYRQRDGPECDVLGPSCRAYALDDIYGGVFSTSLMPSRGKYHRNWRASRHESYAPSRPSEPHSTETDQPARNCPSLSRGARGGRSH